MKKERFEIKRKSGQFRPLEMGGKDVVGFTFTANGIKGYKKFEPKHIVVFRWGTAVGLEHILKDLRKNGHKELADDIVKLENHPKKLKLMGLLMNDPDNYELIARSFRYH